MHQFYPLSSSDSNVANALYTYYYSLMEHKFKYECTSELLFGDAMAVARTEE